MIFYLVQSFSPSSKSFNVDGHVPQLGAAVVLSESRGFVLIPSFFTLIPNSLPLIQYRLGVASFWRWMYSVLARLGQPETRWSMVSSKRPHNQHF